MTLVSHRGIDTGYCPFEESTHEAFAYELEKGIGVEFDPNFTKDNQVIIFHDSTLSRTTSGKNKSEIVDLTLSEIGSETDKNNPICGFDSLLDLISRYPKTQNALHLKGKFQTEPYLRLLMDKLHGHDLENILVFDVLPKTAKILRHEFPVLAIAPSVSHPFDIKRFNKYTGGTLVTIGEVLTHKDVYSWVWLDEWDLKDESGEKDFINSEVLAIFKDNGLKIGLVTPELHGTSPGFLGGESHEDAISQETLFDRISMIVKLAPEIVCTDYASKIKIYENN